MAPAGKGRLPLLFMGMVALLAAMWAGLIRLGWSLPTWQPGLPISHGPLMISGFLGTVIGLERAVALATTGKPGPWRWWPYLAPLSTGLGGLLLIIGLPGAIGPLLMTLGAFGVVLIFVAVIRRRPELSIAVMETGAIAWLVGNLLWLAGRPIPVAVLWWVGFLVLTIAGERLELSRLRRLSRWGYASFLASIAILLIGLVVSSIRFAPGAHLSGLGMLAIAIWLLRYDIARRTIRRPGQSRFIATSLLSGYVWLGIGGLIGLLIGGMTAGPQYDAMLHAVLLGFVMAMIFGHAPIIFPALLGIPVTFQRSFYAHLILLHLSLLIRLVGDLAFWWPGRRWGGLLNVIAVLLFLGNTIRSTTRQAAPHEPTHDARA